MEQVSLNEHIKEQIKLQSQRLNEIEGYIHDIDKLFSPYVNQVSSLLKSLNNDRKETKEYLTELMVEYNNIIRKECE